MESGRRSRAVHVAKAGDVETGSDGWKRPGRSQKSKAVERTGELVNSLILRRRWSRIPQPKPRAALDPVSETAAQTSMTNDSSLVFMSLDAMASSIPEKRSSTPRIPIGNWPRILTKELDPRGQPQRQLPRSQEQDRRPTPAAESALPGQPAGAVVGVLVDGDRLPPSEVFDDGGNGAHLGGVVEGGAHEIRNPGGGDGRAGGAETRRRLGSPRRSTSFEGETEGNRSRNREPTGVERDESESRGAVRELGQPPRLGDGMRGDEQVPQPQRDRGRTGELELPLTLEQRQEQGLLRPTDHLLGGRVPGAEAGGDELRLGWKPGVGVGPDLEPALG